MEGRINKFLKKLSRLRIDVYFKPEPIIMGNYSFEEAYDLVENFFINEASDRYYYPSEVSEELGIEYELTWEVLERMNREEKLETGD